MKKRLLISILAFSFVFTGCSSKPAETINILSESTSVANTATSSEYTLEINLPDTSVEEVSEIKKINNDKPMVALTFDDGPNTNTNRLLEILAENGGKGTFFVIGNTLDKRAEILKRVAEEGHEIGSHGWDHRQLTTLTGEELVDQITETKAKIYDITGLEATLLRPPYGSYNDEVIKACRDNNVIIVKWSVDPHDWKYKDTETIYEIIMANLDDGDIILCHDIHSTTVDAMEVVIPALIEKGYQLVTVSELLEASDREIEAGGVYSHRYN